jgi:hypothetical protein
VPKFKRYLKLNFTFDLSLKTKIMVYKFRVILDAEEDIFRDIAILADDTLEDLHNAIFNSLDLMVWKWPLLYLR